MNSATMNRMNRNINVEDARNLASWYEKNKRELPWRDTGNPYDVWISEIMLQQTRIEAVKPKFVLFRNELPDIQSLAEVDEDRLMRLWEGMGYYSRARNLKKCAEVLVRDYEGKLPSDYDTLRKLPGIGPYTAGAIASIAYGKAVPAVDGNVMRVLARYLEIPDDIRNPKTKKSFESMISDLFQKKNDPVFVKNFNQGLMELGEVICVPNGTPHCDECPWKDACLARLHNLTDQIPYRSALKKRKIVDRTLFILRDGNQFLLRKRPDHGLLAGLYEFPGTDQKLSSSEVLKKVEEAGIIPVHIRQLPDSKHVFTHLEWHMTAYEIQTEEIEKVRDDRCILADKKELSSLAIPSAFHTYIEWYSLRD